ncbi:MAG: mandelate racemase/muconate lactonizing enzyme family protein [Candidatus Bathyarchaeia archaeon]|nr:mandelate racemase/muconate lactonizing enzyme family protein [Candidatus Bathyarchaeota archaeon]
MKITDVKVAVIRGNFCWPLVRVDTDEGISGLGEARDYSPAHHYVIPLKEQILRLKKVIVGEDPTNIERLSARIRAYGAEGRFGGAVSGIEIALWDILGKSLGVPIYKILGGKFRSKIRIYCDCHAGRAISDAATDYSFEGAEEFYTPEAYAEAAKRIKAMGFTILKFDLHPQYAGKDALIGNVPTGKAIKYEVSVVEALRDAVGDDFPLALDSYQGGTVEGAIRFGKAVDPYGLLWIEDIIDWKDTRGFKTVTKSITTPTLTGEDIYTATGFKPLIEERAVDIVAPDIATNGGIMENKKVAWLANLYGLSIAPHCAGSPVSTMANVHAAAAMPENLIAIEFHAVAVPWWDDLAGGVDKPIIKDGYISVPERPGLGVEINEKAARKHLMDGETYFE